MKFIICIAFSIIIFSSCGNTANPKKLITAYYKQEEERAGGGRLILKNVEILAQHKKGDTTYAKAIIKGRYIPNQVPGSAPDSDYKDTTYWRFYKVNGEWDLDYNYKPY